MSNPLKHMSKKILLEIVTELSTAVTSRDTLITSMENNISDLALEKKKLAKDNSRARQSVFVYRDEIEDLVKRQVLDESVLARLDEEVDKLNLWNT